MAIELQNVTFQYPDANITALENINLMINKGERVAIIGQNGAGKSTAVKLMNNINKPTKGTVFVDGVDTKTKTTAEVSRKVGYVFQNPNDQIFCDDVRKEIRYVLERQKMPQEEIKKRVKDVMELTGIREYRNTHPYDIPLPIRRFLTIASVLVTDVEYIILDEPTAGQDMLGCNQLAKIMDYITAQGKTIITISHDMEFVAEHFDRVVVMAHKNVLIDGDKNSIFHRYDILEEAKVRSTEYSLIGKEIGIKEEVLALEELVAGIKKQST